jgi:outer membrane protein OmpA-like peptidoglycan-associated protein
MCIAGCNCLKPNQPVQTTQLPVVQENPKVAERCSPVRELLSKNYRLEKKVDVLIAKAGTYEDRTGAILSNEEAARVAHVDSVCRAWVFGEVSGKQYAATLLGLTSESIVGTKDPADQAAAVAKAVELFRELQREGLLPPEFNPSKVPDRVAEDEKLPKNELRDRINAAIKGVEDLSRGFMSTVDFQRQVLERLTALETNIAQLKGGGKPANENTRTPRSDVAESPDSIGSSRSANDSSGNSGFHHPLDILKVYFSTNSAELSYDGRRILRDAAVAWASTDSTVDIIGYADSRGSVQHNSVLSKARAKEVADVLRQNGVRVSEVQGGGVDQSAGEHELQRIAKVVRRNHLLPATVKN